MCMYISVGFRKTFYWRLLLIQKPDHFALEEVKIAVNNQPQEDTHLCQVLAHTFDALIGYVDLFLGSTLEFWCSDYIS